MPNLKKRLTNGQIVYYNKLLYYGKYAPKYGFIVSQTTEKSKKNFVGGQGNGFSKAPKDKMLTQGFRHFARKRSVRSKA